MTALYDHPDTRRVICDEILASMKPRTLTSSVSPEALEAMTASGAPTIARMNIIKRIVASAITSDAPEAVELLLTAAEEAKRIGFPPDVPRALIQRLVSRYARGFVAPRAETLTRAFAVLGYVYDPKEGVVRNAEGGIETETCLTKEKRPEQVEAASFFFMEARAAAYTFHTDTVFLSYGVDPYPDDALRTVRDQLVPEDRAHEYLMPLADAANHAAAAAIFSEGAVTEPMLWTAAALGWDTVERHERAAWAMHRVRTLLANPDDRGSLDPEAMVSLALLFPDLDVQAFLESQDVGYAPRKTFP